MSDRASEILDRVRVGDCMNYQLLGCDSEAPLDEVADIMTKHQVHALVLRGELGQPVAIVSDVDLMSALSSAHGLGARPVATHADTVSSGSPLRQAARLMAKHGVSHLIVRDQMSGHHIGVISASDIVSVLAGGAQPLQTADAAD